VTLRPASPAAQTLTPLLSGSCFSIPNQPTATNQTLQISASSLVFDDTWIESGFGWRQELDTDPTALRLYEGTVIQGRRYADQMYQQLMEQHFMP
jgi:hypothetical protein